MRRYSEPNAVLVGVLAQVSAGTLAGWDCDRVPAQPGSAFDRLTIHATMR